MNKLTIAATALFLASTAAAHAGNSISFQIEGQNVRIETSRNCASLDCVTIVAPGLSNKPIKLNNINFNGLGSKHDDDSTPSTTAQKVVVIASISGESALSRRLARLAAAPRFTNEGSR